MTNELYPNRAAADDSVEVVEVVKLDVKND
jgi:hypothetical protein